MWCLKKIMQNGVLKIVSKRWAKKTKDEILMSTQVYDNLKVDFLSLHFQGYMKWFDDKRKECIAENHFTQEKNDEIPYSCL